MNKNKTNVTDDLFLIKNPKSMFSESIRTIRTNLEFSSVNKKLRIILITSPEPGDGKSFISANLALAYSLDNKKVLIIDADLRKGRQNKIFGLPKTLDKGYSNLILNYTNPNMYVENYIEKTKYRNLYLLQNGPVPPNPIELLASENNTAFLNTLRTRFDVIILDCPPVIGLSDALVLTKHSDAILVTISNKNTKLESLKQVKKAIEKTNSKITGVVVNKVKSTKSSYYRYY